MDECSRSRNSCPTHVHLTLGKQMMRTLLLLFAFFVTFCSHGLAAEKPTLTLARTNNWLIILGRHLPGPIRINYLEAYCRPGSTDADWVKHTMISHKNE